MNMTGDAATDSSGVLGTYVKKTLVNFTHANSRRRARTSADSCTNHDPLPFGNINFAANIRLDRNRAPHHCEGSLLQRWTDFPIPTKAKFLPVRHSCNEVFDSNLELL